MRKILLSAVIVFSTLTFTACNCEDTSSSTKEPIKKQEQTQEKPVEKSKHDVVGGELQLNDGEKWLANPETTRGVDNIIILMDGFFDIENVDAYHELSKTIKIEFSNIFKKCTMTGPSHDQLHNFLIPIKNSFKGLGSSDVEVCKTTFETLRSHLDKYDEFFITE